jgi:putative ATPase
MAIWKACQDVRAGRTLPVPEHLRDTHYQGAKRLGHGKDYQYSHDFEGGWVEQTYLPEERRYYHPVDRGYEKTIGARLEELHRASGGEPQSGGS